MLLNTLEALHKACQNPSLKFKLLLNECLLNLVIKILILS